MSNPCSTKLKFVTNINKFLRMFLYKIHMALVCFNKQQINKKKIGFYFGNKNVEAQLLSFITCFVSTWDSEANYISLKSHKK